MKKSWGKDNNRLKYLLAKVKNRLVLSMIMNPAIDYQVVFD